MPIRCYAQHDGLGITLSRIDSAENAARIREMLVERGIGAIIIEPIKPDNHRVYVNLTSIDTLRRLAAGANIELID